MKIFLITQISLIFVLIISTKSKDKSENIDLDLRYTDRGIKSHTIVVNDSDFDATIQYGVFHRWLIIFYAETCNFCKQIKSMIDKIIEDKNYINKNDIRFASLDIDYNLQTQIRFNITGIPLIVMVEDNKMITYDMFPNEKLLIEFIQTDNFSEYRNVKTFPARLKYDEFIKKLIIFSLNYYVGQINNFLDKKKIPFKFTNTSFLVYSISIVSFLMVVFFIAIIKCCCSGKSIKKESKEQEEKLNEEKEEIKEMKNGNNSEEMKKAAEEKKEKEMNEKSIKDNKDEGNKKKEKKKKKE
jgi:thiol-disulfide isomerase/thioredoxin